MRRRVVEVLGVVDYRGLPWAAILVGSRSWPARCSTCAPAPSRVVPPAGDARLEELELDVVDGSEPTGR